MEAGERSELALAVVSCERRLELEEKLAFYSD
jgi:hypothetical protein